MAGTTGFEPATSDVTGRRSNQLNYVPAISASEPRITQPILRRSLDSDRDRVGCLAVEAQRNAHVALADQSARQRADVHDIQALILRHRGEAEDGDGRAGDGFGCCCGSAKSRAVEREIDLIGGS